MFSAQDCKSIDASALETQMRSASRNLSRFMIDHAHRLSKLHGIGYQESTDEAPATFSQLVSAHAVAKHTGTALKVFSGGSNNTIYTTTEANWAFRFWHDLIHVGYGLNFNLADEVKVAELQGDRIAMYFGGASLEYKMFMADTAGQSVYAEMHGGLFPKDQWEFVKMMLSTPKDVVSVTYADTVWVAA